MIFFDALRQYEFLQHALVTALAIGIVSGVLGCFIILRGLSLMGDAISHAVLPGVALSYIFGISYFWGALCFGLVASFLISSISSQSVIKQDTAIGITFSSFLALGVILIGVSNSSTDLFHVLFGNILAVTKTEMWQTILIATVVIFVLGLFYRPLFLTSFDPMMAKAAGIKVQWFHYLLMMLLTVVSITAMQSVGTMLVVSLLITPAATAFLFSKRLHYMLALAALFGASASFFGLWIGYVYNLSAGSSIVLFAAAQFVLAFLFSPKHQLRYSRVYRSVGVSAAVLGMGSLFFFSSDTMKEDQMNVVVTNSILYDLVNQVGQEHVNVHSMVPVGKNPHEHEPLPEDISKVSEAEVVFYNGLNLEAGGNGWFQKLMETTNKQQNQDYFAVSRTVEPLYIDGTNEKTSDKLDPHAWLALENGQKYVTEIARVLSQKDPEHQEAYQKNAQAYNQRLQQLDDQVRQQMAQVPRENRLIVTSEGAFQYFSKAYDIPFAYIWPINTEQEGTPQQVQSLVDRLKDSAVPVVFVETSVSKKPMESIATQTNKPIYSELFTDSIAPKGKIGDSYYAMMEWNLNQIAKGLTQKSERD